MKQQRFLLVATRFLAAPDRAAVGTIHGFIETGRKLSGLLGVIMLSPETIDVLFTSGGRHVELLQAFRDAYSLLGITGDVITIDADPLSPALQVADRPFIVPLLDSPNYIPVLTKISANENATVIFPLENM